MSNSPFCDIPFHSCLYVLVFVSFFLGTKQIFFFFSFVTSYSPDPIIKRIIHGEGGDMEFFYQSSTRHLSSGRSDFPHLASHVET